MIAQFSLRLICGMSMMWGLMPRSQVTSGFFRIQMLVVLGLSALSALTIGQLVGDRGQTLLTHAVGTWICVILALSAFLGSVMWTLERRRAGSFFVFLIAAESTGMLLLTTTPLGSFTGMLQLLSELSTASMLGAAMTGMLLGHWFLTAPTMSITPLSRLNLYFAVAGLVRLVVSGIGLISAWDQIADSTHWLWLALRWLAGIIGPLLMVVMVWRILKYRNTQAATGVLFVSVVLVIIGELSAALLSRELQTPV